MGEQRRLNLTDEELAEVVSLAGAENPWPNVERLRALEVKAVAGGNLARALVMLREVVDLRLAVATLQRELADARRLLAHAPCCATWNIGSDGRFVFVEWAPDSGPMPYNEYCDCGLTYGLTTRDEFARQGAAVSAPGVAREEE